MSHRIRMVGGLVFAAALMAVTPNAYAQVENGTWTAYSPGYSVQQVGCGVANGSTFRLTCSNSSGEQRAERRYDTYTGGTHQFEGYFKINSMGGTGVCLKQTFSSDGPYFMLAVQSGGRLYAVDGDATIYGDATVGISVRVNTVNQVGVSHRTYINGSLEQTVPSPSDSFYDKIGTYRTSRGQGPISVTWRGIKFWQQ